MHGLQCVHGEGRKLNKQGISDRIYEILDRSVISNIKTLKLI